MKEFPRELQAELNGLIMRAGSDYQAEKVLGTILFGNSPTRETIGRYRRGEGNITSAAMICCILRTHYKEKDAMQ